ncbi:MAG: PilZ domain-containing protein [Planctomycetes bacterium]|nr:PilZ domain-containing protein [Planctomycetota bacterium]
MSPEQSNVDSRQYERFTLAPMYSSVTARRVGSEDVKELHGHAYDVSEAGVRFELDEVIDPGESITVDLTLPGMQSSVSATGDVVWVNDEADDPGPRRLAIQFTGFNSDEDRFRLLNYLGSAQVRRAA